VTTTACTYYAGTEIFGRAEVLCNECSSPTALKLMPDGTFQCNRCRIKARLTENVGADDTALFLDLIRPLDLGHLTSEGGA
jgi:hypothetical protein